MKSWSWSFLSFDYEEVKYHLTTSKPGYLKTDVVLPFIMIS